MAALCRVMKNFGKVLTLQSQIRNISVSGATYLKEIIEKKVGNTTIVEGIIKPDENEARLIKTKHGACSLCSTGLNVKHTDVLILSQFTRSDGCILPRRITGLCKIQQKRISSLIIMAQYAGLLPRRHPKGGTLHPLQRRKWKKFNSYYDERTIKARYNNL